MASPQQPWKKRQRIPDGQVRDAAEQYDDARRLLAQQPPFSGVLLPLFNTAAVAVELFLKSLSSEVIHLPVADDPGWSIVHASPQLKNHRLVELLDSIPAAVREHLESDFAIRNRKTGPTLRQTLG